MVGAIQRDIHLSVPPEVISLKYVGSLGERIFFSRDRSFCKQSVYIRRDTSTIHVHLTLVVKRIPPFLTLLSTLTGLLLILGTKITVITGCATASSYAETTRRSHSFVESVAGLGRLSDKHTDHAH